MYRSLLSAACVVALGWAGIVWAADNPSLKLVQTIPLKGATGKLDYLVTDARNERLFVANKANNTLDVVDLKAGALIKQIPGQQGVQGVAYAADLDRVFAGIGSGGFCNIFDGSSYKLLKSVKFKDDADNVRYDARTHCAYVAHAEAAVGVIDAKTFELKADIKMPGAAEAFCLEAKRPRMWVNIPSPCQVVAVDTDKNEVVGSFPVKAASESHPIAIDETHRRLFIGCRKKPMFIVLDSENGKELAALPIPGEVDGLAYDPNRKCVYASCGEGFLCIIRQTDADHYEVGEKVPTAKGAKTCCFSENDGKLYLAVPRQPGKDGPEVRVYQAAP